MSLDVNRFLILFPSILVGMLVIVGVGSAWLGDFLMPSFNAYPNDYNEVEKLISEKRFEEAKIRCVEIIQKDSNYPNVVHARILQGKIYASSGQLIEANKIFDELKVRGGDITYFYQNTEYKEPESAEDYLFWFGIFEKAISSPEIEKDSNAAHWFEGMTTKHYLQIIGYSIALTALLSKTRKKPDDDSGV
jgi:tetratricopeptide (TPR) repeat protein